MSLEVDRRVRAGLMKSNRYRRELYDCSNASQLSLKVRIVVSEVVEAILYDCASWTLLKPTTISSVLHTTGRFESLEPSR